jgi:DNA-binding Lrp family transcriptional regulator
MTKNQIITEDQLDLMHIIEKDGKASQRLISQNSGFSIGKVNYCLKALVDIGFIKIYNFKLCIYFNAEGHAKKNSYNEAIYYQKEARIR